MGNAFYEYLVTLLTNSMNQDSGANQIIAVALSNLGMFAAYVWLTGTLIWFTFQNSMLKRTPMVYLFAAFIGLCGLGHLGHFLQFSSIVQLSIEACAAVISLITAFLLWYKRHVVLSVIYHFMCVIGLLRTLEEIEQVKHKEPKS